MDERSKTPFNQGFGRVELITEKEGWKISTRSYTFTDREQLRQAESQHLSLLLQETFCSHYSAQ